MIGINILETLAAAALQQTFLGWGDPDCCTSGKNCSNGFHCTDNEGFHCTSTFNCTSFLMSFKCQDKHGCGSGSNGSFDCDSSGGTGFECENSAFECGSENTCPDEDTYNCGGTAFWCDVPTEFSCSGYSCPGDVTYRS